MTIKPLLDLAAASSTNTYTYNLSIDVVTTGSTTSTLAAAFVADTAATSGLTTDTIDIAAELALLAAE